MIIIAIPRRIPGKAPARNNFATDVFVATPYSKNRILGGIIGPNAPPAAAAAVENSLLYPARIICGIMMPPMQATVAGPEPDMAAKNMLAIIVTIASPPGLSFTRLIQKLISLWDIPPSIINSPERMKNGIARRVKLLVPLRKDSTISDISMVPNRFEYRQHTSPNAMAMGNPINTSTNKPPINIVPAIYSPSLPLINS